MEFPDLGKHCSEVTCNMLDFLPMKCDACEKVFCKDHFSYKQHNCEKAYLKNVQVPVCPLCEMPVPVKRGELPDIQVGLHIDNDCQSDRAIAKRKVYTNRCSLKGCKQKEMIPIVCDQCRLNYCLKHRHAADHKCQGFQGSGRSISQAGAAAIARIEKAKPLVKAKKTDSTTKNSPSRMHNMPTQNQNFPSNSTAYQGSMTEDEALALALQQSLMENQGNIALPENVMTEQEAEDLMLAQALADSEKEYNQAVRSDVKKQCTVS